MEKDLTIQLDRKIREGRIWVKLNPNQGNNALEGTWSN
jgi:hypothetical protein